MPVGGAGGGGYSASNKSSSSSGDIKEKSQFYNVSGGSSIGAGRSRLQPLMNTLVRPESHGGEGMQLLEDKVPRNTLMRSGNTDIRPMIRPGPGRGFLGTGISFGMAAVIGIVIYLVYTGRI